MPSVKLGTVVKDVAVSVRNMAGGSEYREKLGVVRMAIGQLGFTPEEMQKNVKTFMEHIKTDLGTLSDRINKEIHEVVSLRFCHFSKPHMKCSIEALFLMLWSQC